MTLAELKTEREAILAIAGRYGARNLQVFGSVVRAEAGMPQATSISWSSWSPVEACSTSGAC